MLAAIQAPVIMMSQNRQDTKDRLRGELDFDVNRRAESEIQGLARKLNLLGDKIGDVEDLLRYPTTPDSGGGMESPQIVVLIYVFRIATAHARSRKIRA